MFHSTRTIRFATLVCIALGAASSWAQDTATEPTDQAAPAGPRRGDGQGRGRGGERGFDRMMGMMPLLRDESVKKELGVNEEQSKSLESVTAKIREDFGGQIRDFMASFRDLSPEERRARRQEGDGQMGEIRGKINERLQGVLDDRQFGRLKEIETQRAVRTEGVGSLANGEIAATLGLTDDQKQKLRQQGSDSQDERVSLSLEDVRAKVKDILTPDQMGKLDTLLGAAFELPREMLERGRGRFGGGRGRGGDGGERPRAQRQRPDFEDAAPAGGETAPE